MIVGIGYRRLALTSTILVYALFQYGDLQAGQYFGSLNDLGHQL